MLVISRKLGEKLRIGQNIEVAVLEISGTRVVLGIEAPREIDIRRLGIEANETDEEAATAPEAVEPAVAEVVLAAVPVTPPPFEYPSRAAPEQTERVVKTPVVTVRRSRKIAIPPQGSPE